MSETFGGIGSDAISAVPVLEKTNATSGSALTAVSTSNCIACDCVRPVLGMRMRVHGDVLLVERRDELLAEPVNSSSGHAEQHDRRRDDRQRPRDRAAQQRARRARFSQPDEAALLLLHRPVTTIAISAGTKVSDSTNAATSAMMTVSAIGLNILPSTPVKVSIGR